MKKGMLAGWTAAALAGAATSLFCGCETMDQATDLGTEVAVASGAITRQQGDSLNKSVKAVAKTFEDITPEQEYYIGRAVAATLLETYRPYNNEEANKYLNLVGQALARASDKPETYGGYHFYLFDSDEINAFACPGGIVLVSKGLIECCPSEDALASVLAHEVGHVEHQDGLRAIDKSRLTAALTTLATEGTKTFGGKELAELSKALEGSVSDVVKQMVVNGYSRQQEFAADQAAITIVERVGYDPHALVAMLQTMQQRLKPGGHDFSATHPAPADRIQDAQSAIGSYPPGFVPAVRAERFADFMSRVN